MGTLTDATHIPTAGMGTCHLGLRNEHGFRSIILPKPPIQTTGRDRVAREDVVGAGAATGVILASWQLPRQLKAENPPDGTRWKSPIWQAGNCRIGQFSGSWEKIIRICRRNR